MLQRLPILGVLLFIPATAPAQSEGDLSVQEVASVINELLDGDDFENSFWGVQVVDLKSGEIIFGRNDRKSFMPASSLKLFTTASALDVLGPGWQYETTVFGQGYVSDGILKGNLIVRGSGDPTIGGRFNDGDLTATFRQWADSLKARGIHGIDGDIIGDDDIFDDVPLGEGWSWHYLPSCYAAEIGGLVFNDNCVDFSMVSGTEGQAAGINWEPHTDYISVVNTTLTIHRDSTLSREYYRSPGTNEIEILSRLPEGAADARSITIHNPTRYFAHVLRESLIREGIRVTGSAVDVDDLSIKPSYEDDDVFRVAVFRSPPLDDIVAVANKESHNLYAEQLLKTLGAYADSGDARPGSSASDGIEVATEVFLKAGVDTSHLRMVDGSGLSRTNLMTPEMTVNLLRYMWAHPDRDVWNSFYDSLPIAGVDGTLAFRFLDSPGINSRAKTGFVSYVRALSGYVTTRHGEPLAFSILSNHYTVPTARVNEIQDGIVNLLVRLYRN